VFSLFQVPGSIVTKMRVWLCFLWLIHCSEAAIDSVRGKCYTEHLFQLSVKFKE